MCPSLRSGRRRLRMLPTLKSFLLSNLRISHLSLSSRVHLTLDPWASSRRHLDLGKTLRRKRMFLDEVLSTSLMTASNQEVAPQREIASWLFASPPELPTVTCRFLWDQRWVLGTTVSTRRGSASTRSLLTETLTSGSSLRGVFGPDLNT